MTRAKYAHARPAADEDVIISVRVTTGGLYEFRLERDYARVFRIELDAAVKGEEVGDHS